MTEWLAYTARVYFSMLTLHTPKRHACATKSSTHVQSGGEQLLGHLVASAVAYDRHCAGQKCQPGEIFNRGSKLQQTVYTDIMSKIGQPATLLVDTLYKISDMFEVFQAIRRATHTMHVSSCIFRTRSMICRKGCVLTLLKFCTAE